jgi:hypothetical protein
MYMLWPKSNLSFYSVSNFSNTDRVPNIFIFNFMFNKSEMYIMNFTGSRASAVTFIHLSTQPDQTIYT